LRQRHDYRGAAAEAVVDIDATAMRGNDLGDDR
jgi:hypothetical protein